MARGDSINSLLQMQAYRRAEMEGQIAKRDVYGETKAFVEQWRKNNGLEGTKALPNRNEVPFQWMLPFLDKVETEDTVPSPLVAQIGGQGPHTNLRMYDGKLRPYIGATGVGDIRLKTPIPKTEKAEAKNDDMMIASASDIGQQVLQQRAAESKAGKIDRGSRSYIGEDHQRAREVDGEIYWYDEYKHMPFYQEILKKHGHTEELQQIQNEIQQKQSSRTNDMMIASDPSKISQPTEKGYFLGEEDGIYGHVFRNEGGYLKEGNMYDEGIHGLPLPLM